MPGQFHGHHAVLHAAVFILCHQGIKQAGHIVLHSHRHFGDGIGRRYFRHGGLYQPPRLEQVSGDIVIGRIVTVTEARDITLFFKRQDMRFQKIFDNLLLPRCHRSAQGRLPVFLPVGTRCQKVLDAVKVAARGCGYQIFVKGGHLKPRAVAGAYAAASAAANPMRMAAVFYTPDNLR